MSSTRPKTHRPERSRRSQQERRADTRAKLLDATLDSLAEVGFAGTSTTAVVQRAGLSRGAQVHHFPTKQDLVVAAAHHVIERQAEDFRRALASAPDGVDPLDAILGILWEIVSGKAGRAWSALRIAARSDEELRRALLQPRNAFMQVVESEFRAAFPDLSLPPAWWQAVPLMVFGALDGLAQHQAFDPLDVIVPEARRVLAGLLEMSMATFTPDTPPE